MKITHVDTLDLPCSICKRMDRKHKAKGVCTACYRMAIYRRKKGTLDQKEVFAWDGKPASNKTHYNSAHKWAAREWGSPSTCDLCSCADATRYEWAMKTYTLSKRKEDWYRLCKKCHVNYDKMRKIEDR